MITYLTQDNGRDIVGLDKLNERLGRFPIVMTFMNAIFMIQTS